MAASQSRSSLLAEHATPLFLAILLLVVAVVAGFVSPIFARIVCGALIGVVLVVGIHIFTGNSGILSFGHMGFVGIAAYVTAWLTLRPQFKAMMLPGLPEFLQQIQTHPLVAAVAGASVAALVAFFSGIFLMRLRAIAATIATLAFLAIVYAVYSNSDAVTGGVGSLAGIPTGLTPLAVLPMACVAILIAHVYARSASGLALKAVRDDEVAARAAGIRVVKVKLQAYVVSAFVCGIAGYLQARFLGVVSPENFYFSATLSALTMLIVGGMYSLSGAVCGVLAVTALTEILIRLEGGYVIFDMPMTIPAGMANCVLALLLCVVLIKRPRGLFGDAELAVRKRASLRPMPGRITDPSETAKQSQLGNKAK